MVSILPWEPIYCLRLMFNKLYLMFTVNSSIWLAAGRSNSTWLYCPLTLASAAATQLCNGPLYLLCWLAISKAWTSVVSSSSPHANSFFITVWERIKYSIMGDPTKVVSFDIFEDWGYVVCLRTLLHAAPKLSLWMHYCFKDDVIMNSEKSAGEVPIRFHIFFSSLCARNHHIFAEMKFLCGWKMLCIT